MKKQLICASVVAAAMLLATTGVIISNETRAKADQQETVVSVGDSLNATKRLDGKNETVYVMTDATGVVKNTFIGSTLYTGEEKLPFEISVKYYLDGTEISATELAGKSGHVKMVFSYESTVTYQGMEVPFVAVTGMSLDSAKFSKVKVKNGKVVSEGENYLIYGYGVAGANEDLGTDFLPEEFEIEANVTNFALGMTYTVLMNDLIAEIDTSRLTSVDEIVNAVNQLADGVNQLANGSTELTNGMKQVLDGTKELHNGATALSNGIASAATGANELSTGMAELANGEGATALKNGATQIFTSTLTSVNLSLSESDAAAELVAAGLLPVTADNFMTNLPKIIEILNTKKAELEAILANLPETHPSYEVVKANINKLSESTASLTTALQLLQFAGGVSRYIDGVAMAANGSAELSAGLNMVAEKTPVLVEGLGTLVNGETQLYEGSVRLQDGLQTFKTSGIDKLVSFANNDLSGLARKSRQMIAAARSYRNFGGSNAETVKFIVKTSNIR